MTDASSYKKAQADLLELIKAQQESYLAALKLWTTATAKAMRDAGQQSPVPPTPPKFDLLHFLPTQQGDEVNRDFVERLVAQQQEFLARLTAVVAPKN